MTTGMGSEQVTFISTHFIYLYLFSSSPQKRGRDKYRKLSHPFKFSLIFNLKILIKINIIYNKKYYKYL